MRQYMENKYYYKVVLSTKKVEDDGDDLK